MKRVFAIDVLQCPSCGRRMKAIAEITDKRVARKMLKHVDFPSDAPEQWPVRGPPELVGSFGWFDDEQRPPDDVVEPPRDVESRAGAGTTSTATGACVSRAARTRAPLV